MINDKLTVPEDQSDLKPGQIKFYDNVLPKLPAGSYTLKVTQEIVADGVSGEEGFPSTQAFTVAGPRFRLPPEEIHSVYPPPLIAANYDGVLPQMTFRKRNLPWERTLKVKDGTSDFAVPWLALVVFEEDELILADEERPHATQTRALVRSTSEVLNPGAGYLKPNLTSEITDEKNCFTIDISKTDFLALTPKVTELPFLAHVREVNTDHKPFLGMHADGWFSVLLANRLPKTPATLLIGQDGHTAVRENYVRNIVHLVSLEGFAGFLSATPSETDKGKLDDTSITKVRLASLASWEFRCTPPEVSFDELMKELKADTLKIGGADTIKHAGLKDALAGGYAPLQYHTRMGEKTMAWYRGPLLPVITPTAPTADQTFFSAESGLLFDKDNGIFDLSFAIAWQIGRLLALADSHFANTLLDWKKLAATQISHFLHRSKINTRGGSAPPSYTTEQIQQLMSPDFEMNALYRNFLQHLEAAKGYFKHLSEETKDQLHEELDGLPGILTNAAYQKARQEGTDPMTAILQLLH